MRTRTNHHVVRNPQPGQVIRIPAGSRLELKFARRSFGVSQWRLDQHPGHVLPLTKGHFDFEFLVFSNSDSPDRPLRLIRYRIDRGGRTEVRDLTVIAC